MNNKTINLYEHYKNTENKLKIVCDWDEVIQACEPFALWKASLEEKKLTEEYAPISFEENFETFWCGYDKVEYSPYGSKTKEIYEKEVNEKQLAIKNSPNFYQETPFLTIAEDLLRLIKEDKVEQIIFLVYSEVLSVEGKYSENVITDSRIETVFNETFGKFPNCSLEKINFVREKTLDGSEGGNEFQYKKSDWIKKFASDFDIFIDDNPNICRNLVENIIEPCSECLIEYEKAKWSLGKIIPYGKYGCVSGKCEKLTVLSPYYPAIEHDEKVLLVKNEVSDLKKEDFGK